MANPQAENGHIDIANEIVEALMRQIISPDEWRILLVVLRKTYGFHKKQDWISLSQFCEMTGMRKPHVCRSLGKLIARNMITRLGNVTQTGKGITRIGNAEVVIYGFQKDFEKWQPLPKQVILPKQVTIVTKIGNASLPKQVSTKENTTKENTTKERLLPPPERTQPPAPPETKDPRIKQFFDHYFSTFQTHFGQKPILTAAVKDAVIIKRLLKEINLPGLKDLLQRFFDSTDNFICQSGYTIGAFGSQINKLRISGKRRPIGSDDYGKPL